MGGDIVDSQGSSILEEKYWDYLEKVVIPYSQAVDTSSKGKEYMVGALSRLNLNKGALHTDTKSDASEIPRRIPLKEHIPQQPCAGDRDPALGRPFDRAPRVERVQGGEQRARTDKGRGGRRADRGAEGHLLLHALDRQGRKVQYGNIIVPTQQNQIGMEKSVVQLVEQNIDMGKEKLEYEIEKLIRAYDPCMSCAKPLPQDKLAEMSRESWPSASFSRIFIGTPKMMTLST